MRLLDKVALITGSGSEEGIGRASALTFAREGAKVVCVDIQQESTEKTAGLVRAQGGTAIAVQADVTDPRAVSRMIKAAVDNFGRLDILWNHAGIGGMRGTILDIGEDDYDKLFRTNVKSVFLGCKEAIPVMKSNGGGVILNTASIFGLVARTGNAIYPATKGAVVQLTRCLALDHAEDGIRVNCVCPGSINTMNSRRLREESGDPDGWFRRSIANTPLGRLGVPEDIANVAALLCSDEASFITGAAVVADGGWTVP